MVFHLAICCTSDSKNIYYGGYEIPTESYVLTDTDQPLLNEWLMKNLFHKKQENYRTNTKIIMILINTVSAMMMSLKTGPSAQYENAV